MNCTELDVATQDIHNFVVYADEGFAVAALLLFGTSMLLLLQGERLVRPLAAIVAGVAGTGGAFVLTRMLIEHDCTARLIVSGAAGILGALMSLCLFKTGLFVLGAGAFGTVSHYIYDALPLQDVAPPFVVFGRSGYYYLVVGLSGLIGAVVSQFQQRHFIRIASSLLGGGGVALCVHLVFARLSDDAISSVALLVVVVVSTISGVFAQHRIAKWRERKKKRKRKKENDDDDERV